MSATDYSEFISSKERVFQGHGFEPMEMIAPLYPWQKHIVRWISQREVWKPSVGQRRTHMRHSFTPPSQESARCCSVPFQPAMRGVFLL